MSLDTPVQATPIRVRRAEIVDGQLVDREIELPPGTVLKHPVIEEDKIAPPTQEDLDSGRARSTKGVPAIVSPDTIAIEDAELDEDAAGEGADGAEGESFLQDPALIQAVPVQAVQAVPVPAVAAQASAPIRPPRVELPAEPPALAPVGTLQASVNLVDLNPDDARLVYDTDRWLELQGKNLSQRKNSLGYLRRYLLAVRAKGMDPKRCPTNLAAEIIKEGTANLGSQNAQSAMLASALNSVRAAGHLIVDQIKIVNPIPKKPKKDATMALNQNMNGAQQPDAQLPAQPAGTPIPIPMMPAQAQAQPMQQMPPIVYQLPAQPAPRAAPQPRKSSPDMGKIRIFKRATGMDGHAPGTMLVVGMYPKHSLSNFGTVEEFILSTIVPVRGPKAGDPDTTYVVEHLDAAGRVTSTDEVPVAGMVGAPQTQQQGPTQAPNFAGPGPGASDRVLELLMKQNDTLNQRLNEMLTKGASGGLDNMSVMTLMELRSQSEAMNRRIEEIKSQKDSAESRRFGGRRFGNSPDGGGGGLDGFEGGGFRPPTFNFPPPMPDPGPDKALELASRVLDRAMTPPPVAPVAAPVDPLAMMAQVASLMATMNRPQTGPDPIIMSMLQQAEARASRAEERADRLIAELRQPEKQSRGLGESIADIKAIMGLKEAIEPSNGPPSGMEIIGSIIENADKIFDGIAKVGATKAAASVIDTPPVRTQAPQAPQAPRAKPPVPVGAQDGIRAMRDATDDMGVIRGLLLTAHFLGNDANYKALAQDTMKRFLDATSYERLRSTVAHVAKECGAVQLASNAEFLDRVTTAIHRNYSALYAKLTADMPEVTVKNKVLPDAAKTAPKAPPAPAPQATPAPAPQAAQPAVVPDGPGEDGTVEIPANPVANFAPKSEMRNGLIETSPSNIVDPNAPTV